MPSQARLSVRVAVGCWVAVFWMGPAPAWAQTGAEATTQVERERRTEGRERERLDAAAEAALFARFGADQRVSYAEVLESPDDPELNFRWARTQVADGNFTGAAATLQRILLIQPDLALVRMFYAVVLFRLGNLPEAERELARLETQPGARHIAPQIRRYRDQVRRAQRRTRHSLSLMAGTQHDTNRNSGPDSNQVLIGDVRFTLGSGKKSADAGWFSLARWQVEHDLGYQEDRQLVSGLAYFHSQQDDFASLDVQALKLDLGLRTRRAGQSFHPRLVADLVDLSRETYLRSVGLELEARRPLTPKLELATTALLAHDDYDGIPEATTASDRSGYRSRIEGSLALALATRQRVELSGALTRKSANQSHHAYLGGELGLGHTWILESGAFVLSSVTLYRDLYKDNDDDVSRSRRRDLRTRGRLSLGLPLNRWPGSRFPSLEDLVLSISGEVQFASSNLPNYDFKNRKLSLTLGKRIDF